MLHYLDILDVNETNVSLLKRNYSSVLFYISFILYWLCKLIEICRIIWSIHIHLRVDIPHWSDFSYCQMIMFVIVKQIKFFLSSLLFETGWSQSSFVFAHLWHVSNVLNRMNKKSSISHCARTHDKIVKVKKWRNQKQMFDENWIDYGRPSHLCISARHLSDARATAVRTNKITFCEHHWSTRKSQLNITICKLLV